jgi:hypothetical protein
MLQRPPLGLAAREALDVGAKVLEFNMLLASA